MAKVFSGRSNTLDLAAVVLDQAPGAPNIIESPDAITFTSPMFDFDGSPITPNGPGSNGCDDAYLVGALINGADGTSAIDSLSGAEANAGYQLWSVATSPGEVHVISKSALAIPSLPSGGLFRVAGFVSDGSDV